MDLDDLTRISLERRQKILEYHNVHAQWSTWNFHAKKHPGYNLWAVDNAFGPKDLKSSRDFGVDVARLPDGTLDMDEGAPLWALRHLLYHEKEVLARQESDCLRALWAEVDDEGVYKYSLEEIARAYDRTPGFTHRHLYTLTWFKSRNAMEGRKQYKLRTVK